MKTRVFLLLSGLALLLTVAPALAFPPLPSSFYGHVNVNCQNVPAGTRVEALIGGVVYGTAHTSVQDGFSVYGLNVLGDDISTSQIEGGITGDQIRFKVNGMLADHVGIWYEGSYVSLDISIGCNTYLPLIGR
jgi:hypothetical protein